jgi:hypothetical protein
MIFRDIFLRKNIGDELPWDFIDIGVSKEFLKKEWKKARNESLLLTA